MTQSSDDKTGGSKKGGKARGKKQPARAHTIELSATDITPDDKNRADQDGKAAKTPGSAAGNKGKTPEPGAEKQAGTRPGETSPAGKKDADQAPPPAPPRRRGGYFRAFFAALLGGIAAIATLYGLIHYGLIDSRAILGKPVFDRVSAIEARLAKTEAATGNRTAMNAATLDRQSRELAALAADQKKLSAALAVLQKDLTTRADGDKVIVLADKLAAASARLEKLDKARTRDARTLKTGRAALEALEKDRQQLATRLEALARQLDSHTATLTGLTEAKTKTAETLGRFDRQLASLKQGIQDIEKAVSSARATGAGLSSAAGVRLALLERKLARLGDEMKGIQAALEAMPTVPLDMTPRIKVLESTMNRVNAALSGLGTREATLGAQLKELSDRIGLLSRQTTQLAAAEKRFDTLKGEIVRLGGLVAQLKTTASALKSRNDGSSAALDELDARLKSVKEALGNRLKTIETTLEGAREVQKKITALDEKLATLNGLARELRASQQHAARALAAAALQKGLASGKAYARELQAFRSVAPEMAIPDALVAGATSGIATREALRKQFTALRRKMESRNLLKGGKGLMGRLLESAGSVVQVRRTGPVAGNSTAAILSRISGYLDLDDLENALREAGKLGKPDAEKLAGWTSAVRARLAAEAFAVELDTRLTSAATTSPRAE